MVDSGKQKEQRALEAALASIEHCQLRDPVAPALTVDDEIVCRGKFNATFARHAHG